MLQVWRLVQAEYWWRVRRWGRHMAEQHLQHEAHHLLLHCKLLLLQDPLPQQVVMLDGLLHRSLSFCQIGCTILQRQNLYKR